MQMGSIGTKPVTPHSLPTTTSTSGKGTGPLASFTVKGEGGKSITISVKKPEQKFTKAEVEQIRTAFKQSFGEGVTKNAFRMIDQTVREDGTGFFGGDKDVVTGEHILSANMTAVSFLAPGLRFEAEVTHAKSSLKQAQGDLKSATKELETAREELTEARKETGSGLSSNSSYSHISLRGDSRDVAIETAKKKIETAEQKISSANERITSSKEKLVEASKNLEIFKQSLSHPLGGEDLTTLKNSVQSLKGEYQRAETHFDKMKEKLNSARDNHQKTQKLYDKSTHTERQSIDLNGKESSVLKARENFDNAKLELTEAKARVEIAQSRLDAMQNGPILRQFQSALDHIGEDPRFVSILENNSPGKMTGNGLGTLEKLFSTKTMGNTVFGVIPGYSMVKAFKEAGDYGVSGGMLERSTKFMDESPLARMLATSLSKAQETESNKLGIQGTLAYLSFATTLSKGSLTSLAMEPLTELIKGRIEHTTGHIFGESLVGHFIGNQVTGLISGLPETLVDTMLDTGEEMGLDKLTEQPETPEDIERMKRDIETLKELELMGMPMIHVRPFTGSHQPGRDLPLSDRDVAISFMMYLGPKEDPNAPNKLFEQRRLDIREKFFGAKSGDDYTSGIKLPGESDLRSTLYGSVTASKTVPKGTNALHLIMASLDLTENLDRD